MLNRQEAINKINDVIWTAEKFKNAYFLGSVGNAYNRRRTEEKNSIDYFEWQDGKDVYSAEYTVSCSCKHTYASGSYTKNGNKTNLTAIKNSLKRLEAAEAAGQ